MEKLIQKYLKRAEGYKDDLLLAIEECKDCEPQAYLFSLYHAYCQAMRVVEQVRLKWPEQFVGGLWSRFVHIRSVREQLYRELTKAIERLHECDYNPIDDLPF